MPKVVFSCGVRLLTSSSVGLVTWEPNFPKPVRKIAVRLSLCFKERWGRDFYIN